MNRIKNVLGGLFFFFINVAPWIVLIYGVFSGNLFYLCFGGIFVILNKLSSIEDLLISISNVLLSLHAAMKKLDAEDSEKEEDKLNKNMFR
jgi:hypothetical protein